MIQDGAVTTSLCTSWAIFYVDVLAHRLWKNANVKNSYLINVSIGLENIMC